MHPETELLDIERQRLILIPHVQTDDLDALGHAVTANATARPAVNRTFLLICESPA